ncbi:methionine synthase [Rhodococcus phenolicus]|uniref:methionine synthase n=1 Tax=Rhodococcus phenolicus TaxID=263849 RepID=UPI0008311535|nr:methionine synthase [Rhodococcus phenolicus]
MTAAPGPGSWAGVATGIGSWPGVDARESAAVILGELAALPHLVELPARGLGADMIGRASALLVDLHLDGTTTGYRLTGRRGAIAARAEDLLHQDLDGFEEAWENAGLGSGRTVKVQSAGPLTLAAHTELTTGRRVLTDPGAVRDLSESLGEGLSRHAAEITRRTGAAVVVQLDEPALPDVLAGTLKGRTILETVAAVPEPEAQHVLDTTIEATRRPVAVHCCGGTVPTALLRASAADAVALDVDRVSDLDGIGELLDAGTTLLLGLVPTTAPATPPTWREAAAPAVTLIDRLGFPRTVLRSVAVTPACGLAGADPAWARTALRLTRDVAAAFAEDPESL